MVPYIPWQEERQEFGSPAATPIFRYEWIATTRCLTWFIQQITIHAQTAVMLIPTVLRGFQE